MAGRRTRKQKQNGGSRKTVSMRESLVNLGRSIAGVFKGKDKPSSAKIREARLDLIRKTFGSNKVHRKRKSSKST